MIFHALGGNVLVAGYFCVTDNVAEANLAAALFDLPVFSGVEGVRGPMCCTGWYGRLSVPSPPPFPRHLLDLPPTFTLSFIFPCSCAQLEWMSNDIGRAFDLQRSNPFELRSVHVIHTLEELDELGEDPRVSEWPVEK